MEALPEQPPKEPEPDNLLASVARGWGHFIVTEIPRRLEPVDKDTFIEGS